MNISLRVPVLCASLLIPYVPQAQQARDQEPEPQGLSDCERKPPETGYRWEYSRDLKNCSLTPGELERCKPGWVCKDSVQDYRKGNSHLAAMKEPSLFDLAKTNSSAEEYRFTWLRTFDHPVTVRISLKAAGGTLITKMTSGQGGYSSGHLIMNKLQRISREDANSIRDRLEGMHFWEMFSTMNNPNWVELDGASWTIEGIKDGKYHFVDRSNPDCDDLVRKFGLEIMVQRANLKLLYREVY